MPELKKRLKLGSLFDGIGGFPFAGVKFGIEPVWASEIEPWPIKVTQKHFPGMKHLGDITKINGAEIEPVDIITFGSPCQDLSVAGKRAGLDGERSGLFSEAIRIIKEMRGATNGLYPTFAVWENVLGALSSNSGRDFVAVLRSFVEIGAIDICWRVLDAQFFGVPQRRRRIFLVADFTGERAEQILFESEGLRGYIAESGKAREETAGTSRTSIKGTDYLTGWDNQEKRIFTDKGVSPTLAGSDGGGGRTGAGYVAQLYDMTHADEVMRPVEPGIAPTLNSRMGTGGNQVPVMLSPSAFACNQRDEVRDLGDKSGALQAQPGMKQQTFVAVGYQESPDISLCVRSQPSKADKPDSTTYVIQNATRGKSQNGLGISQEDVSYTLDSLGNHAVATVDCRNLCENEELSGTLQHKESGGYSLNYQNPVRIGYAVRRLTPVECLRLQGFPDDWLDIEGMSDTQKYKAIGNSVAIPCVEFVLGRMAQVASKAVI